ncbi:MAG: alkane 1-monooxygenase [Pseudomonadota bacterium]|nr:alkane 1-monooxygenase [Pseudomonadota bacterium]
MNTQVNDQPVKAGFWAYARFYALPTLGIAACVAMILGGAAMWQVTIAFVVVFFVGDMLLGDDDREYEYARPGIFYGMMYSVVPIIVVAFLLFCWVIRQATVPGDFLGIAAFVESIFGYDMIAAHANNTWFDYLGATGALIVATVNGAIVIGHELTHRTEQPFSFFMGRLGEAFSMMTYFSIEHPYGHHATVATSADPATAVRGESFYHFVWRSIIGQYRNCWRLEADRCRKIGAAPYGWRNRLVRSYAMEAAIVLFAFWAAGILGVVLFLINALAVHVVLELANYTEHYGLVRDPADPVQPRHSWNTNNRATYWYTVAIGRHSHHHADASVEFWDLKPYKDAPMYATGYITAFLIALVPPLWYRIMTPKLLEWDAHWANDRERELAREANGKSGIPALVDAARQGPANPTQKAPA